MKKILNTTNSETNILKGSTKISISVSELRQLLTSRDTGAHTELIDALTRVEETSEAPAPDRYAASHSATRMIIDRLSRKAESLTRQRLKRRDRKSVSKETKSFMSNAKPVAQAEEAPSLFSESDIVKIKQIMRRRDGIRKNLLALIEAMAARTKSPTLTLVARSIEIALDLVGRIHSEIIYITNTGRIRTNALSLPTVQHLIQPLLNSAPASE